MQLHFYSSNEALRGNRGTATSTTASAAPKHLCNGSRKKESLLVPPTYILRLTCSEPGVLRSIAGCGVGKYGTSGGQQKQGQSPLSLPQHVLLRRTPRQASKKTAGVFHHCGWPIGESSLVRISCEGPYKISCQSQAHRRRVTQSMLEGMPWQAEERTRSRMPANVLVCDLSSYRGAKING